MDVADLPLDGIEVGRCASVVNGGCAGCSMVWIGHLEDGLSSQGLLHASTLSDLNLLLFAHARTDTDVPDPSLNSSGGV